MPGKYAPLILSRGEQFMQRLTPRAHGWKEWPVPSIVETTFYATDGGVIGTIDGDVAADAITFDVDPDEVDIVPIGAWYETFLEDNQGKKHQVRHGQVTRHEAQFFNTAARVSGNKAQQFSDTFATRKGRVGNKWVILSGKPWIYEVDGNPNAVGVAPNHRGAMRLVAPLNTNTIALSFNLLNPGSGMLSIGVSSDAAMSSYRAITFVSDSVVPGNNKVYAGSGSGIYTRTNQVPAVSHLIVDNTNYKLRYDDFTKKLALLNSDATEELISWTDEGLIVPAGPGHRYVDLAWEGTVSSGGPKVTMISAQDGF